ncbi:cupin [Rhizobium tubonense]|uniref:Cupin n=2 Tax=Rhizobium tubonense TaxID=484088 RepID=A0A2W4CDI6_9HYPH|nr:cupin [Rhizobium tubonense]PZM08855.1 cupin [Rhizobium tubonense]
MGPKELLFAPSEWVPNNQRLSVLIYSLASTKLELSAKGFERLFKANEWVGIWRNGVFTYQHYHVHAHEVLAVARGNAKLLIGGPTGREIDVSSGDCLVLPSGTGHCNLGSSPDFLVVGGYPPKQHADIQRGPVSDRQLADIASVALPKTDPIYGRDGPLVHLWH